MRATEFTPMGEKKERFKEMFSKFLPLCMKILKLDSLPKMEFHAHIHDEHQPTFGRFDHAANKLEVALANRHPNDILRTVAHELQHYKQGLDNRLDHTSGQTGSPIENEAHAMAGIVMRHFNKDYPEYLGDKPVIAENFADGKVKGKSRPGRVKRAGASCSGSVTSLRKKAKAGGEKGKMYHWCANMKSGKKK
mgnify:CR=1 FL=1